MEGLQQFKDFRFFWPNVNEKTISVKYATKQTEMWPGIIIRELIQYPKAQRASGTAQMGQNMSQIGTKNTLKQLKNTILANSTFQEYVNPSHHKIGFR